MKGKLYTESEIVLCTFFAIYGNDLFEMEAISKLENRSMGSIAMKIEGIAAMLEEYEVPLYSGITPSRHCGVTNYGLVKELAKLDKLSFQAKCQPILSKMNNTINAEKTIQTV